MLIKCRECSKQISSEALSCPHCGATLIRKKKATGFKILGIVILVFLLFSLIGVINTDTKAADKTNAWIITKKFVQDSLKSPSTANFGDESVVEIGGGKFQIAAWVDADNTFGAKIRHRFICQVQYTGDGKWALVNLKFSE